MFSSRFFLLKFAVYLNQSPPFSIHICLFTYLRYLPLHDNILLSYRHRDTLHVSKYKHLRRKCTSTHEKNISYTVWMDTVILFAPKIS